MTSLPRLQVCTHALFLDFDGTLADIAPTPDAVFVAPPIPEVLVRLQAMLGGALALVTGRPMNDIDPLLLPAQPPAAYEHGAVRRAADGRISRTPVPDLAPALVAAQRLVQAHPGLLLERKSASIALHYRQAPELGALCQQCLAAAIADHHDLQLLQGKAVVEVKSTACSKGAAIAAFMHDAPFEGRVPVFAGDDVTDEAGFDAVQRLGGIGIKVGEGPTLARARVPTPEALRQWLIDNAHQETCHDT